MSGIITAFLVESYKQLQEDYIQTTSALLSQFLHSVNNSIPVVDYPTPTPNHTTKVVNRLWFMALWLALTCAMVAMLSKQWMEQYSRGMAINDDIIRRTLLRQYRYEGLQRWRVRIIVESLPFILHIALLIFAVGLVEFLWYLDRATSIIMLTMTVAAFLFYLTSMTIPAFSPDCAFKTPISHLVSWYGLDEKEARKVDSQRDLLETRLLQWVERHARDPRAREASALAMQEKMMNVSEGRVNRTI